MKLKARTTEGNHVEFECAIVHITDKDGMLYRIEDDKQHGFEILAENGRALIEPHVSNHLTIFTKE